MKFYEEIGKRLQCNLCRHFCKLKTGQSGICGVNKNVGDRVENLVYGKVAALHIDPIEKKPLFHFLPESKSLSFGTVGCNFRCDFCQNYSISQTHMLDNSLDVTPQELVTYALNHDCKSISYTYNEPTIFYPFIRDVAKLAQKSDIKSIMVSNGLESPQVIEDMATHIDACNIDLKSFNPKYYKKVLKGDLQSVLDTIKRIKKTNIHLEITTLLVPDTNDSDEEINSIASFIVNEVGKDTPWHISAFHPDYKLMDRGPTPIDTLQRAYRIGQDVGLDYVYMGNIPNHADTKCPKCAKLVLSRVGFKTIINILDDKCCPDCGYKILS